MHPPPLTLITAALALMVADLDARADEPPPPKPAPTPKPPTPPGPPGVYYHVEHIKPGANPHELGTVDLTRGGWKARYGDLDWGVDTAVHPGSGRFALSLGVAGDARTVTLDGHALTLTSDQPIVLAIGTFAHGVDTIVPGDPTCVPIKCFEKAWRFSVDGSVLYTLELHQSTTKVRRVPLADPTKATLVFDRKRVLAAEPAPTPDHQRWAYDAKDGIHVEAMPPVPAPGVTKKPRLPKLGKAVVAPKLLVSAPIALLENTVAVFRREPTEQREGYIELYDLTTRAPRRVYTFAEPFALWQAGFKTSAAHRSVLLVAERKLLAVSIVDGAVRTLADDANVLFDVSADGRFALVETSAAATPSSREGNATNPLALTVIEIGTGRRVASQPIPVTGTEWVRTEEARFL
ncbi:MAG: hypothetical protein IPL61_17810 [Myxococcales bacterium]|nr:hypothetical protein [Myxococcales bacterium]